MGSSVSRAITSWKQRNDRRCLLVGLDNSGKTSEFFLMIKYFIAILNVLCKKEGLDTVPTVGFSVESVKMKKLTLDIWVSFMITVLL